MYRIITDIGVELNLTEPELVAAAEAELHWMLSEKEYDVKNITVEHLCQDISGHLTELNEKLFSLNARKIVEQVLHKKRSEMVETT